MLLSRGREFGEIIGGVDSIHNYYERLVIDELTRTNERCREDSDFLADTACVALNSLPPRYIRHDVDMTFFMSTQELAETRDKVTNAVKDAIVYVEASERERSQSAQPE